MAGYSATPLAKKLGYKAGFRALIKGAPEDYRELLEPLPPDVVLSARLRRSVDLCHLFTRSRRDLERQLPRLIRVIRRDGTIWVSWPKKASRVATDITENTIRDVALPLGLVDTKVCAIDATWSGLRLVIRKALR